MGIVFVAQDGHRARTLRHWLHRAHWTHFCRFSGRTGVLTAGFCGPAAGGGASSSSSFSLLRT
jgi:hypothetical protein